MRRGEVAGLAWEDIDLELASLTVNWQLGVINSKPAFKPRPKSRAGTRTMALDPATVDALREHRRRQLEERIAAGPVWQDEQTDHLGTSRTGLVFTWEDGRMIHPERISGWFGRHCRDAGLPRIRLILTRSPARGKPVRCSRRSAVAFTLTRAWRNWQTRWV